jgi:hypothetical protein
LRGAGGQAIRLSAGRDWLDDWFDERRNKRWRLRRHELISCRGN